LATADVTEGRDYVETQVRVSIVIPTFNMSQLIGETLTSVLNQTFGNFEVIVVDDCSTDETAEVVKAWSAKDARIKYLYQEVNSNLPAVHRNSGIQEAKGEYISFLDHDDLWLPRKLERQIKALDEDPTLAMVHSYLWDFTERSKIRGFLFLPNPWRRRGTYELIRRHNVVQCSSAMVRTEMLRSIGGFDERKELRAIEDYHLWLQIAKRSRIGYISEVHGLYRVASNSTSTQEDLAMKHNYFDQFESTLIRKNIPRWPRRIVRKTVGFPLALYYHLVEGPIRQ